jgi:hypothetical protein
MNRLKKKAKTEFIASGICTLITIPLFLALAHTDAKGLDFLLIWVLVGVPTGLGLYLWETKKLKQFDEREREIIQKAFSVGMMAFTLYLLTFCLAAFFMIGGGGRIPVVFMPVMLFAGVFFAQCTQSFIILFRCAKEDDE